MNNEENRSDLEEIIYNNFCKSFESGVFNISFTKADKSIREMRCTRDPLLIPVDNNELTKVVEIKEGAKPRKANFTVLRVYDLSINEWRSFKLSSLISKELESVQG